MKIKLILVTLLFLSTMQNINAGPFDKICNLHKRAQNKKVLSLTVSFFTLIALMAKCLPKAEESKTLDSVEVWSFDTM